MFNCEQDPLSLLLELTPKLAKRRYRQSIYEAWNCKCGYCGNEATSLDHIIPRFRSGSSNRNNLLPACQKCNNQKGSEKMEEWYIQQTYFCEQKLTRIKSWMSQGSIDIFAYNITSLIPELVAG
jgi:HNH endonuclease